MKKHTLLLLLFLCCLRSAWGQEYGYGVDFLLPSTIESDLAALNNYRTTIGPLLTSRHVQETTNNIIHERVADVSRDYDSIATAVDQYMRALDVIDVLMNGLSTTVHVVNTYKDIKSTVKDYKALVDEYLDLVFVTGQVNMSPADIEILNIMKNAATSVLEECEYIYNTYAGLAIFVIPAGEHRSAMRITTAQLNSLLDDTNACLDRLAEHVRQAYRLTRSYMRVRFGYFKEEVYIARTRHQWDSIKHKVDSLAFERWKAIPDTVIARQNRMKETQTK